MRLLLITGGAVISCHFLILIMRDSDNLIRGPVTSRGEIGLKYYFVIVKDKVLDSIRRRY